VVADPCSSGPGAAAAAALAAIESTLKGSGGDEGSAIAAERIGLVVAASYPRAKLTDLGPSVARRPSPLDVVALARRRLELAADLPADRVATLLDP
jgi:hypothetical protein